MEALNNLIHTTLEVLPRLSLALIIILIGYIVSKLVASMLKNLLVKIGIDKLGEKLNEIEIIDKSNVKIKLSTVASKFVFYLLFLIFAVAATDIMDMPAISELVKEIFNYLPNLVVALVILVFGLLFGDMIRRLVDTTCKSIGIPSGKIISTVVFYFIIINVIIIALNKAKVGTDFLSTNLSIIFAGIAFAFAIGYGLASRKIIANFLASFYSKDLFTIGDEVMIDGEKGTIVDINKSNLILENNQGKIIYPLGQVTNSKVIVLKESTE